MSSPSPWPNVFIAGAAKAGTTSLWRYVDEHPAIFMSPMKEPHFFCKHRPPISPLVHDEASYLRLFAGARTPLRGEASPSYLWSERAAAAIKQASPCARRGRSRRSIRRPTGCSPSSSPTTWATSRCFSAASCSGRWAYGPPESEMRTVEPRARTAPGSGR